MLQIARLEDRLEQAPAKYKNLLLLTCRSPYLDDSKIYPPLGNLYLKAAVNQALPEVNVTLGDDDYDLAKLEKFEPYDMIGVSVMTPQRQEALKILKSIKEKYPDKKVIIGGPHVQHYFNEVIAESWDYVVPRDGQRCLIQILQGNAVRINVDIQKPDMFASMPNPDRQSLEAIELLKSYHYELNGRKSSTMLTATGCTEHCSFCEDARTNIRWRPLEKLTQEMDDIKNLGFGGVYIFDDLFAIAMSKVKPICEEFRKRDLIFRCNGQARYFTKWGDEFAKMLADNGCVEIAFGHETGSQKILDNIEKRTTVEQNYKSIEYAKKYGIKVKSFILLGLPGEDWETLKETEKFIATGGMDDAQVVVYMPYKGTKIRDDLDKGIAVDMQMMVSEVSGSYGVKGGETVYEIRTKALSAEDLKAFRNYLVDKYKPKSHTNRWKKDEDKFFQTNEVQA